MATAARRRVLALALGLGAGAIVATAPAPATAAGAPLDVHADAVSWEAEGRVLRAVGNVRISDGDNWVRAGKARVFVDDQRVEAWQGVSWGGPEGNGSARAATVDTDDETGSFFEATMTDPAGTRAWGDRIERTGPDTFVVYDGGFTPCDCPAAAGEAPAWKLTAAKATVVWRERVSFTHGTFWGGPVPFLYLPAGYAPLTESRQSGLLFPKLSLSKNFGFRAEPGVFLTLGPSADVSAWGIWTARAGWGLQGEFRARTRTGSYNVWTRWFNESADAPYLEERNRAPGRRTHIRADVEENPWGLFRLNGRVNVLSDRSLEADFAEDLDTLTRQNAASSLGLSREVAGWGAGVVEVAASQSLLDRSGSTGSRTPRAWLRSDPIRLGPLPAWVAGDLRYDLFAAHNEDLGPPWQPTAFDRQGERLLVGARTGARFDPVPGLFSRTVAGIYWIDRSRELYRPDPARPDIAQARHVHHEPVTDHATAYVEQDLHLGLVGRTAWANVRVEPGANLLWILGSDQAYLPIEDVDAVTSQTWLTPNLRLGGELPRGVGWDYVYRYPMWLGDGTPRALGIHSHEASVDAGYGTAAARLWQEPGAAEPIPRIDVYLEARPWDGHRIGAGFGRTATGLTAPAWDAGRPGPFVDDRLNIRRYREVYAEYRWEVWRLFGKLGIRRRFPQRGGDVAAWVERSAALGYRGQCDCWWAEVGGQDLPGDRADRITLNLQFALLGGVEIEQ